MFFEIFQDRKKNSRWRLKAGNGRLIAHSQRPHASAASAKSAIEEADKLFCATPNFDIYSDKNGEWRWRCVKFSETNRGADVIVADSAESYTRKSNARRMIEKICAASIVIRSE